ncbi:MAG: L-aspartate oxidase, partial [Bdellovibrionales bacterium]|nr:L-aspartate oxidase [Bdellovibrionales bacterium]
NNTQWAQGGIAAVTGSDDNFELHIQDTLVAGAGLCRENVVRAVVEQAPERIVELQNWGVHFDLSTRHRGEESHGASEPLQNTAPDLTKEGGHSRRRILHVADQTGRAVHAALLAAVKKHPNIRILENHIAIDLLTTHRLVPTETEPNRCIGAYVMDRAADKIFPIVAESTVLATGGAGKVYMYTSNWDGATGDGIAMAYRAGARVANMEFMQFHPTCLYHPDARNFLISEALRGEGAELINAEGIAFMKRKHPLGSLAPRDIVAREIDAEMKRTGAACVYLDIRHQPGEFIEKHFPAIHHKCLEHGIDMRKDLIPVVPAAHYLCGGIVVDGFGQTDIRGLYAIGESACTGLHGANRLASNSLLECVVYGHESAQSALREMRKKDPAKKSFRQIEPPAWVSPKKRDSDEMIVISHLWNEIRQIMWNYVGIVRTNKRLSRAQQRLKSLVEEIHEHYWDLRIHPDILELRNIALVASLTVECALRRKESRGIHFNMDHGGLAEGPAKDTILSTNTFVR